jgi:hypothetical protein
MISRRGSWNGNLIRKERTPDDHARKQRRDAGDIERRR